MQWIICLEGIQALSIKAAIKKRKDKFLAKKEMVEKGRRDCENSSQITSFAFFLTLSNQFKNAQYNCAWFEHMNWNDKSKVIWKTSLSMTKLDRLGVRNWWNWFM